MALVSVAAISGASTADNFSFLTIPFTQETAFTPVFCFSFSHAQAQCPQLTGCPGSLLTICDTGTNHPQFWNAANWLDPLHLLNDLPEVAVDLSVTANDICNTGALVFSYELLLDLDNSGSPETLVKSQSPPPPGALYAGNLTGGAGAYRVFDQRNVSPLLKYRFGLSVSGTGNTRTAQLRWKSSGTLGNGVLPQLPPGNHEIRWTVRDGAGSSTVCAYPFKIKDCLAPQLQCPDTLSVQLEQWGQYNIKFESVVLDFSDNLTPKDQLKISMRIGNGNTFPLSPQMTSVYKLLATCSDISENQHLQCWAKDKSGNASFCDIVLEVSDDIGFCSQELYTKSVCPVDINGQELSIAEDVFYNTITGMSFFPFLSTPAQDICWRLHTMNVNPLPVDIQHYAVTFIRDDSPFEGVAIQDLARLEAHLSGIDTFTMPWQWIAADITNDWKVDVSDLQVLNQVLSGQLEEFPNNNSWRFFRSDVSYPEGNPIQWGYASAYHLTELAQTLQGNTGYLTGVKIGDIDGSLAGFHQNTEEREQSSEMVEHKVELYPNPAFGPIYLESNVQKGGVGLLRLWESTGSIVFSKKIEFPDGKNRFDIDLDLCTGVYFWQMELNGEVFAGKQIKR
jgi:hypothetical protein